jgi:hypothetical protein
MKKFFSPNLEARGRWVRGALGALLVMGGVVVCAYNVWVAVALILSGGFCWLEAVRGWCVMRACGIRTKF